MCIGTFFRVSVLECISLFRGRSPRRGRGKMENVGGEVGQIVRARSGGGRRYHPEPSVEISLEMQQDTYSSGTRDKKRKSKE